MNFKNLPKNFTYTAHTGCKGTKSNSLEAIETGIYYGANTVEFDLNFTPNGEAVLSHDEPKGGEVTLDMAFEKISHYENVTVNVDVKSCANLKSVMLSAEKYGITDRIFFTGIELKDVSTVREDCPDIPYFLNYKVKKSSEHTEEYLQELIKTVKDCGAVGINFNYRGASKKLVDAFHQKGLLVSIWTVNSKFRMLSILLMAPDNITTRRPDKMQKILQ